MSTLSKTIKDLEDQQERIGEAIRVLRSLSLNGGSVGGGKSHRLSPEGRRRIAEAQKRRWAKARAAKK